MEAEELEYEFYNIMNDYLTEQGEICVNLGYDKDSFYQTIEKMLDFNKAHPVKLIKDGVGDILTIDTSEFAANLEEKRKENVKKGK